MSNLENTPNATGAEVVVEEIKEKKKFNWRFWFPYFILAAMIIVFSCINSSFLSAVNFSAVIKQTACVACIAFGMIFIITAGEIDLSVGAIMGLSGLIAATAMTNWGCSFIVASLIALGVGLVVGVVNGLLVAKFKLTAFLATLATMNIVRGIALTLTGRMAIVVYDQNFMTLWGNGEFFTGLPKVLVWIVILFVVMGFIYHFTPFGNHVKATGGNRVAAQYTGINTQKVLWIIFAVTGVLAAISGMIMVSRLGVGRPETGEGYELDSIAAVVLGGTSMSGGSGNMIGAIVGALLMSVIVNGLTILGMDTNYQQIVKGLIIILAISINRD